VSQGYLSAHRLPARACGVRGAATRAGRLRGTNEEVQIEVRKSDGRWSVARGGRLPVIDSFALKSHATAYARALAQSSGADLVICDADGCGVLQDREN
jgi:hypothetical protein